MTPGARVAAAIEILDVIAPGAQGGLPAEQALTRWARASRFAGSKDRAAVRDHVFAVLRNWRGDAVRGGAATGRGRMIGRLRATDQDIDALFDGVGHAPAPLDARERHAGAVPQARGDVWNLPDWLCDVFEDTLGTGAGDAALALTDRAPVTLRVNTARVTRAAAQAALLRDGIETVENPHAATALTVQDGPRRVRGSQAYTSGDIEIQDAASQAAALSVTGTGTGRALDFCAGGGGKALALAAAGWQVTAHDIDANRMRDLPARAARGGHDIAICDPGHVGGTYDLVLCDAPCSGAGTWRRSPEAKWALTPERLETLVQLQREVLDAAMVHVAPGGRLAYATCSVLHRENGDQIDAFLERHADWRQVTYDSWPVDAWGDGFFIVQLARV